jgi:hypothetical protein
MDFKMEEQMTNLPDLPELSDLRAVEKKAFKATFEDGVWDLYLGVMLLPLLIFPFVHYVLKADPVWALLAMMLIYALGFAGFRWLKKHVTQPRLGMIQPGPSRRKKLHTLRMLGAVAVLAVIALVLLTVLANPLTQITVFGISLETAILGIPLLFWKFTFLAIIGAGLAAWLLDFSRLLLYGVLLGIAIPVDTVYFSQSGWMPFTTLTALLAIGIGLVYLVRFLRRYPLPQVEE